MSHLSKRVTALAAAALATAVVVLGPGAPAHADHKFAICSVESYSGRGDVWYTYTGGYDYIDYYEYTQQNGGPETDVRITQYSNSTIIYQWSDSRIPHFEWESHNPSQTVRIAGSAGARTVFRFAFDKTLVDPICAATTATW